MNQIWTVLLTFALGAAQYPPPGADNAPTEPFRIADNLYYNGMDKADALRAHPDGPNPFVDSQGYRSFIEESEKRFRDQLAREKGGNLVIW